MGQISGFPISSNIIQLCRNSEKRIYFMTFWGSVDVAIGEILLYIYDLMCESVMLRICEVLVRGL